MKAAQYICGKLRAFGVTDAQLLDMYLTHGVDPDSEVTADNADAIGTAMTHMLEELILAPYQKSVSESGFSVSWDFANVSKYYLWLCNRYGLKPSSEVKEALGISMIMDRTGTW